MTEPMNVIFIITDQQRRDHLSCYGNPTLKTPNIDSIAEDGVRFENYICNTPICMPNRANFFTGCYPSVHGTRSNGINLDPEFPIISEILRQTGYYTISIGKNHCNFFSRPSKRGVHSDENIISWLHGDMNSDKLDLPWYGYEEVHMTVGHGDWMAGHYSEWLEKKGWDQHSYSIENPLCLNEYYYETEMPEELFPTNYITKKTVEFLENYSSSGHADKPFFLHCSFPDPHHPVCPPGKYKDLYSPDDIELPANFEDGEKLLNHGFLGELLKNPRFRQLIPQKVSKEEAKMFTALTYGSISMIDDGIGKILHALEKSGMTDNTMVIFTSDHGDMGGDHGLILKGPAHYRGIINMPLLWKIPGLTKKSTYESLISTIDLSKTILNLLRIKEKYQSPYFQGYDFTPIFENLNKRIRKQVLIEHDEEIAKDSIMRLRTLVTDTYRLTIYDGEKNIGDLFNYREDNLEVNNLWDRNDETRDNLIERLLREIIKLRPRLPERAAYN
ncbi:MAG: sulfatase-like hydrolase/transferase [Promethearchaeia archaeon]